jgi:serine kinase of HPr protein (carbohydrate metabolism regulator)
VSAIGGVVVVRPAASLTGLLEVRGLGIRRLPFASQGRVALVVDLDADDADRLPAPSALEVTLESVKVPRIPVDKRFAALPLVIAALITSPATVS